MSSAISEEAERILDRMEELRDISLEEVIKRAHEINRTLTLPEICEIKDHMWDDFILKVSQEYPAGDSLEWAKLMLGSFKLQILGSSLVEKVISQIKGR